jgi:hypothetical protein
MATNTAGTVARDLGFQAVHYLRKNFTYLDLVGGATTEHIVGVLPAGAVIIDFHVVTTASFNDTDRDDLDVGFTAGAAELGSAMDINTAVWDRGDLAVGDLGPMAADQTVYFAPTTASAAEDGTTGAGVIVVVYVMQ